MRPDTDAIDTRGDREQRVALLSAVEVAHGARMQALADAIRAAEGVELTEAQLEEAFDRQSFRFGWMCAWSAISGSLRALAQSGAAPKETRGG